MLPVIYAVSNSTFWLVILVVALITLIIGTLAGAFAAYKVLPNNAKKQAENIIKEARKIENLHNLIKNNGGDFNITKEEIKLSEILVN